MKHAIALILTVLIATPSVAEAERHPLVVPAGTELVVRKVQRANDLYAEFAGSVDVSGTFMGWWPGGAMNKNYKEPDYVLIPDKESKARLPHFLLRDPPYRHRYIVRDISVTNGSEALREAAGMEGLKRLLERRVNHVRVTGKFRLSEYVVGIECDAPWARARLTKAELPVNVAGAGHWPYGGC